MRPGRADKGPGYTCLSPSPTEPEVRSKDRQPGADTDRTPGESASRKPNFIENQHINRNWTQPKRLIDQRQS
jgi:hypothetical protein